jgi:hypothetical protein
MKYHADQFLLPLTQAVTTERGISLVCIPDRDSAECELTRLRHKFGPNFIKATIRKDKPTKKAARTTYTLRYFVREAEIRQLF